MIQKNKRSKKETNALLSIWKALVSGGITPNMRAVYIDLNEKSVDLRFIFDGPFTEEEEEEVQCMGSEVVADLPDSEFDLKCERVDYPQPIVGPGHCVYRRKEPSI